mgnify:CR=1 FL=1
MHDKKRILAIIGLVLIGAMYGCTLIFAIMGSPESKNWLMGAIFCTIAVPVIIYAIQLAARLKKKPEDDERE